MARNQLFRLIANKNTTSYSSGDAIQIFYDDSTEAIEMDLNGVTQGSGALILRPEIENDDYSMITVGPGGAVGDGGIYTSPYSFCDGVNQVEFIFKEDFPYAQRTEKFSESCSTSVCDISPSGSVSITKATGIDQGDGALTVTATSSNTPIKYALFDFNYSTEGQSSGTFSGLYPGEYTVYAKDAIGCRVSWTVNITFEAVSDYAAKYDWEFADLRSSTNNYKVELLQRNYSGSVNNQTKMGPVPVIRRLRGENSNRIQAIYPSEITVNIQSATDKEWLEIFAVADEREFLVKYYYDSGSGYNLIWQGFALTGLYTEPYEPATYYSTFTATDGLADLKSEPFLDESGNQIFGSITVLEALIIILQKTGLEQDFRIAMSLYESDMDQLSSDDPLNQLYFNTDTFYENGEPSDCYTVLDYLLSAVNCKIVSYGGYWYVIYKGDQGSTFNYREFTNTGTYVTNASLNPQIDFKESTQSNRATWKTSGKTLQGEPVYKNINIHKRRIIKSVVNPFERRYVTGEMFTGFNMIGWSKTLNGDTGSIQVVRQGTIPVVIDYQRVIASQNYGVTSVSTVNSQPIYNTIEIDRYLMKFDFDDNQGGNAYVASTGSIEYKGGDTFSIKFDSLFNYNYRFQIPYAKLKFRLKIGTKYLQKDGSWSTTETDVALLINNFNSFFTLDVPGVFDESVTTNTTTTYELRIYDIDPYEADIITTEASLTSSIQSQSTTNMEIGERLAVKSSSTYIMYYYSLASNSSGSNATDVTPNDNSNYRWVRDQHIQLPDPTTEETKSTYYLGSVDFTTYPDGLELPEVDTKIIKSKVGNVINLDVDLNLFDLDTTVNNTENLVKNYLRLSDGTPTAQWGTNNRRIQDVIGDQIATWYNKSAYRINGSLKTDIHIPFYSVFKEVNDSNRIYALSSIDINDRDMTASAEMIEIDSDDQEEARAYSSGYSSGYS